MQILYDVIDRYEIFLMYNIFIAFLLCLQNDYNCLHYFLLRIFIQNFQERFDKFKRFFFNNFYWFRRCVRDEIVNFFKFEISRRKLICYNFLEIAKTHRKFCELNDFRRDFCVRFLVKILFCHIFEKCLISKTLLKFDRNNVK